ncbi:MAG: dethiobiotin synthase [Selenomonadaceae bacterium]|nr:dethiobiotin synthase [Selenomonadaceae bacterium]
MKNLFVTGTGTDVGKTFVTDLIIKNLREGGFSAGYYKAAASGIEKVPAGKIVSYVYKDAVSPHLAAKIARRPIEISVIEKDFAAASNQFEYLAVEGSGGIICPLRWDEKILLLEDVIKILNLPAVIVADSGLGTINATVLTVEYLRQKNIPVRGIILNRWSGKLMEVDNAQIISELTGIQIIAKVPNNAAKIDIAPQKLAALFSK